MTMIRTLRRKAAALLTLLPLLLLNSVASARFIKGKRSRLRTLTQTGLRDSNIMDHIFEPESEVAHVVPNRGINSSDSGGKACAGKAKAKKAPLLLPLAQPPLEPQIKEAKAEVKENDVKMEEAKNASTLCLDDEETADDTDANSANADCTSLLGDGPLSEQLTRESFHLGMNLGTDSSGVGEILQSFLNSIVLDDLAACSSSGEHRYSPDANILTLDFDVDDDTVPCLDEVPQRMGIPSKYCSEFNVGVSAIHDGMPYNILVLSVIQGINDRCNLISELDGVMAVDTLCAFYIGGGGGKEGDHFTTGDESGYEEEDENYSGDGTIEDYTDPINSGTDGDGNSTTVDGSDGVSGGSDNNGGNNVSDTVGTGTDADAESSGSDGVSGGSDNNGGSNGSDTAGTGTDGDDNADSNTGDGSNSTSSGTDGDGDTTSGGGGYITVDQDQTNDGDVDGGDGGVIIDLNGDSNETGDADREISVAGLESQGKEKDSMRAGGYLAIAATALLLMFLLFAAGRRRRTHVYMGHKQLDDDFEEDDTYLKDETSNGDSPRSLSHVVDETDGSMMSGFVISPQNLGSPYDRAPRSHTRDVHVCSSATCDMCERRRQSGLQFVPTGMPSHSYYSSNLPRETTRRYVSEDTVNL